MFNYPCNVDFKIMLKWACYVMLCLNSHLMQFIKFISNILKVYVANLFHNFHIKESIKKYRLTISSTKISN